ncbi:hypothetical protein EDD71_101229 [Fonticella tunisiensis]|uniref:Uncharacterized protein n=1 Tax=Fonticella tunisiensis TaxID=1096341 RepID=A0A4R7KVX5_9CLOT|nr:hypothetical protein EDD71_101229 [Fonticella tunisiensis]
MPGMTRQKSYGKRNVQGILTFSSFTAINTAVSFYKSIMNLCSTHIRIIPKPL